MPDGSLQPNCFQYTSILNLLISMVGLNRLFSKNRFFGRERMTWWNYDSIKEVDVVAGCYMLVRHQAIKNVGGLDERFFMYGEEMDWCRRMCQNGWKVVYYPDAHMVHYGGISSGQNPIHMRSEYRNSILYYMKKHHGVLVKYMFLILLACNGAVRLPYWIVRWLTASGITRPQAKRKLREILAVSFGWHTSAIEEKIAC